MTTLEAGAQRAPENWLESEQLTGTHLGPTIRIEDYVEDGIYVLRAEIPGVDPDHDLDVTIGVDRLTIKGERKEERREKDHRELHYGGFFRTVALPRGARADDIAAAYADGVLTVRVPLEATMETQHVPVHRSEDGAG